ncbi:MAG: leucine-rich repeat domain-containing protein [Promethearchaeota archaeon]
MAYKTPIKINEALNKGEINKDMAADLLIYLIENADMVGTRIESIKTLQKIGNKNEKVFSILENLMISDSYEEIRTLAAITLKFLFQEKALSPLKWALDHEKSWQFLLDIVSYISEISTDRAKSILIEKIKTIENYQFNKSLSPFFKTKEIYNLDSKILGDIVNNYIIIQYFQDALKEFNYQIENGLVTELNLSFASEKYFGWKVLKYLPSFLGFFNKIRKLELKSNQIGRFPNSISSIKSLIYLDLSHNNINTLPEGIQYLKNLEYLNIRYNNLTEIPNSIDSLTNLKVLDLKHNKLSTLPTTIGHLTSLEVLNLHGNQFNMLPKALENLSSLKTLKIGLNNVKSIPEWIKNLISLRKLGLGGNKSLYNFQEWIDFLPPLEEINLYDCDIKKLPDSIGALNTLEVLKLPNNQLNELPDSFMKLAKLKTLDLSWNDITELPEWISSLSSLEELNLRGNKLETLPETISSLSSLKRLNITLNKNIIQLPRGLPKKGLQIVK